MSPRLPPATPLDLEKRRSEMAKFDAFGPRVRAIITESPIDIDVQKMLPAFRHEHSEARKAAAFASADGFVPDATPAQLDEALAVYLEKAIAKKVPGYKPLARRDKQTSTGRTADVRRDRESRRTGA